MALKLPGTCSRCSVLPETRWHRSVGPVFDSAAVFPPATVVLQDGYHLSYSQICAANRTQTLHAVDSPEFCILTFPRLLLLHIAPISPK